ncbi:MAG: hypothetical protein RIQ93_157 [Verrucomicrobiota bacterium]|jgi:3-deoxy-D-manno-octulosonic-acid transferase
MLWLYRLLFVPGALALAPFYLWRMRRRGGYRAKFGQRFGGHPALPKTPQKVRRVWLQAVSVGEVLAIGPLLEGFHRDGVQVYLTTTTSTGYRLAFDRYSGLTVGVGYFPLDAWPCSACAWRRIDPDLAILTEGERWPEHLAQAKARGVPVICINARVSDRSFARLRALGPLARLTLRGIDRFLPASVQDETRLRELGVDPGRMRVTGNIKLDVHITPLAPEARRQLLQELGLSAELVILGSSTWPGEEAALLQALALARHAGLRCSLLLVPRHAERRTELERLLRSSGWTYHFRSQGPAAGEVDVAVGDTTGELRNFTQLADIVFVGKSLPPHHEGQTPVEAAALQKPILFGPAMSNFLLLSRDLVARGAAVQIESAAALAGEVEALLRDDSRRQALAAAAGIWRRENIGAVARTLDVIREELGRSAHR